MSDNALAGTKRAAEDGGAAPKERKKRSRWGQKPPEQSNPPGAAAAAAAAVAAAAAAVAPPVAAVETPEMVKARQLAELQASIDAQLQAAMGGVSSAASGFSAKPQLMPGLAGGGLQSSFGAAGARAAQSLTSTAAAGPGSITMDAEGNLVDAAGNVISSAGAGQRGQISSLKVNLNAEQRKAFKVEKAYIEKDRARNPYYDPRVVTSKLQRKTRHLKFHGIDLKAGKHVKEAERMRARVAENELAEELKARGVDPMDEAKKAGTLDPSADPNTMALGQRKQERKQVLENVPDLEWWDAPFISSYDDVSDGKFNIVGDKITHLIEHPVQIAPPGEDKAVPSIPLYLTKQERKKLRTKNRVERQRDLQEQIRMGLEEKPDNKLKISNFMKSLVADAVADPTAIEADVRKQVLERRKAHEERNQQRKLSKAERKEKKMAKIEADKKGETFVAVFKVKDLSSKKNRYKVDINATENHLSGVVVHTTHMSLVVVEGGGKAIKRYKKLMLQRIDWKMKYAAAISTGEDAEEEEEEDEAAEQRRLNNSCQLVWEGTVLRPTFYNFRTEELHSAAMARKFLTTHGVAHYWDRAIAMHDGSGEQMVSQVPA